MDGSTPERQDWERDAEWERATRRDFPLLPIVIGIALALLLLLILRL
jgi:hypothetical protein